MKGPEAAIWWYDLCGSNSSVRYCLTPTHYCPLSLLLCQHNSGYGCKLTRPWLRIPCPPCLPETKPTRKQKKRNNLAVPAWPQRGCIKSRVSKRVSDGCDNGIGQATPPTIPLDDTVSKLFITSANNWNQTSLLDFRESPLPPKAEQAASCSIQSDGVSGSHLCPPTSYSCWVRSAAALALI